MRRLMTGLSIVGILLLSVPPAPAETHITSTPADLGSLVLPIDKILPDLLGQLASLKGAMEPPTDGIRVGLISSGVDTAVLPSGLRPRVTRLGNGGDAVGYGTYAASVIFQLAPNARITSLGVYPSGTFSPTWQADAFSWVASKASDLDVVLYAVPPNEFLDPVSAFMASGRWAKLWDAIGDNPTTDGRNKLLSVALDPSYRAAQVARASAEDRVLIEDFATLTQRWEAARSAIAKLAGAGVSFIVPAGDLGPKLQTIMGLGNLAEVITVGGYDGDSPSPASGAGPSAEGRVKPDLLASTGIAGLIPESSSMASTLREQGLLDPSLEPQWSAGAPLTTARARLDTTFTSAAVAAVATGQLAAEGLRDTAKQRGALIAASVPISTVPAWVQGAGVLKTIPDSSFASSRTLALSNGDLGLQPDGGQWSASIPLSGLATGATSSAGWFAGVAPDGNYTKQTTSAPPVSASVNNQGVQLQLPMGTGSYEGGLYCGYTAVGIPTTGSTIETEASVKGIPAGTEQVPTCFVQGTELKAFNFYIHDAPAENLTFALIPSLPEEAGFLEHPLTFVPVDVVHPKLYIKVSGTDGFTNFPNVPPGHYRLRQFADYASPKSQVVRDSSGNAVTLAGELGGNPGYQDYYGLVLSATGWNEQSLKDKFGVSNVTQDKPSGGWWVQTGPRRTRVLIGYTKKMPGTVVTSRYIDLMAEKDFSYLAMDAVDTLYLDDLEEASTHLKGWRFSGGTQDPEDTEALFNPAASVSDAKRAIGIAQYRFALAQPNFIMNMSLNFAYKLDNASLLVIARAGDEASLGVVTPSGSFYLPTVGTTNPIDLRSLESPMARGSGTANFEFFLKSKSVPEGTLTFMFIPSRPVTELAAPISSAGIGDLSFALETWTNALWPAASHTQGQGHIFSFDSNYSQEQMSSTACRQTTNGTYNAEVCEDWQVFVHTPKEDASVADIVLPSDPNSFVCQTGRSIAGEISSAGGSFYDPARGVTDFSAAIASPAPSTIDLTAGAVSAALEASKALKTNGRFWEQLAIPHQILAAYPGIIGFHIVDDMDGKSSPILPHRAGHVPVKPYIPFVSKTNTVQL